MTRLKQTDEWGVGIGGQKLSARGRQESAALMAKMLLQVLPEDREQEFTRWVKIYRAELDEMFPDIAVEKREDAARVFAEMISDEFTRLVALWSQEAGHA